MTNQYIQNGNNEGTEMDGEWVILNSDQFTVTKLNNVGGYCWSLLREVQTVDTLTKKVLEMFTGHHSPEQVRREIDEFLVSLLEFGLITDVDR
jgi:hypothetical protein